MKEATTATARIADIILTRTYNDQLTLGTIKVFDKQGHLTYECKSIELPWINNRSNVSCIPEGTYPWEKVAYSSAFNYQHIHIKDVPGRSGIKIHVANYVSQLRGCVAPGLTHALINRDQIPDVTSSRNALTGLLNALPERGVIQINSIPT